MGQLKTAFEEFLSSEDFDLMYDDEYENWLAQKEAYEQAIGDGINQNYCN